MWIEEEKVTIVVARVSLHEAPTKNLHRASIMRHVAKARRSFHLYRSFQYLSPRIEDSFYLIAKIMRHERFNLHI